MLQAARILWVFLFLLSCLPLAQVMGADSTSFNPTTVAVVPKGAGGVPVGTVIAWPVSRNPEDMDKWLECDGRSISSAVYPELFAVVGGSVPDYRGKTFYGRGGAAPYGQIFVDIRGGDAPNHIDGLQNMQIGMIGLSTCVGSNCSGAKRASGYAQVNIDGLTDIRYLVRAKP